MTSSQTVRVTLCMGGQTTVFDISRERAERLMATYKNGPIECLFDVAEKGHVRIEVPLSVLPEGAASDLAMSLVRGAIEGTSAQQLRAARIACVFLGLSDDPIASTKGALLGELQFRLACTDGLARVGNAHLPPFDTFRAFMGEFDDLVKRHEGRCEVRAAEMLSAVAGAGGSGVVRVIGVLKSGGGDGGAPEPSPASACSAGGAVAGTTPRERFVVSGWKTVVALAELTGLAVTDIPEWLVAVEDPASEGFKSHGQSNTVDFKLGGETSLQEVLKHFGIA